ncbi:MAG TPA: PQQ-dependent sugar dehydrogenase [Asticcacaulis sp.]|nr:PQQ-dependent sugar dehydrogenase [Asticcacaulis sp.]
MKAWIAIAGSFAALIAGNVRADAVSDGQTYFKSNCALCHDVSPAQKNGQGPGLYGVVGRKVGAAKGFDYGAAMKAANAKGQIWTADGLNGFLTDPQKAMPGTAMPVKITDPTARANVVAYLISLTGAAATAAKPAAKAAPAQASANPAFDWHKDAPGVRHHVGPKDLPAPFATESAGNSPVFSAPPADFLPKVPAGFGITVFSRAADHPRQMHFAPNGDLFFSEPRKGQVSVFHNNNGVLDPTPVVFASGLDHPFGIAFYPAADPKYVYVATPTTVVRYPYHTGAVTADGPAETIVSGIASGGSHNTRDLAFSKDGKSLYISVGSATNDAEDMKTPPDGGVRAWEATHGLGASWSADDGRALVLRVDPDGGHRQVVATGLRNCVGVAIEPASGDPYCTTNERDGTGDNLVPDYFTRLSQGATFGWPWYYLGDHEDPRHAGERPDLRGHITVPDVWFVSHSAPLQFAFYEPPAGAAHAFPAAWRGDAFVVLHGSWNRSARTGSKVVRVLFKNGRPTGEYEDFLTGLIADDKTVLGRPSAVAVAADGTLYVGDDAGNVVWHIVPTQSQKK